MLRMSVSLTVVLFSSLAALGEEALTTPRSSTVGPWHVADSCNFRICCLARFDAQRIADHCEQLRRKIGTTWLGSGASETWKPRCQLVLHVSADSYLRELGPGAGATAGASSLQLDGGKVQSRRIDVRADRVDWYDGALAHELTHVVLADGFSDMPIPRWADEGLAVLADLARKQDLHLRDLNAARDRKHLFRLVELLALTDYPSADRQPTFYGQSASLASFLVHRATPQDFIQFLILAQEHGYDQALLRCYRLSGVGELERQWLTWAADFRRQEWATLSRLQVVPTGVVNAPRIGLK